nr:GNAT family N-acetyltransferase [uncultured Sphingomonas sp.]
MGVRRLEAGDAAVLGRLKALFDEAFEQPGRMAADAGFERLLARAEVILLVAEDGGELAGGLLAYALPHVDPARDELYLYDLAVAEAHRRRGVASALIEALGGLATKLGASAIFVQADDDDAAAQALYARFGEGRRVHHFDILPAQGGNRADID